MSLDERVHRPAAEISEVQSTCHSRKPRAPRPVRMKSANLEHWNTSRPFQEQAQTFQVFHLAGACSLGSAGGRFSRLRSTPLRTRRKPRRRSRGYAFVKVDDLPPIFHEYSRRHVRPRLRALGFLNGCAAERIENAFERIRQDADVLGASFETRRGAVEIRFPPRPKLQGNGLDRRAQSRCRVGRNFRVYPPFRVTRRAPSGGTSARRAATVFPWRAQRGRGRGAFCP